MVKQAAIAAIRLATLALTAMGTVVVHASVIYDSFTDFSATNNPTGVWSYGWMPTDYSSFHLYPDSGGGYGTTWYDSSITPSAWRNDTGTTHDGVAPGQFSLHPGQQHQPSVLRFTAPSAATADISWTFFAGDIGTMSVGVRDESSFLWTASNSGSSSLSGYAFSAGETLDFLVYGGYGFGNTPLHATIDFASTAAVPEPSSLALFALGLGAVALRRRRR